jgi:hypothetical protein
MKKATKVCTKCGAEKSVDEFRTHKSGFILNQCRDCEREANRNRARAKKGLQTVTLKNGKEYQISPVPIVGGRKVVSTASNQILYVQPNVSRDEARAIYATVAKVPYTGISATKVE